MCWVFVLFFQTLERSCRRTLACMISSSFPEVLHSGYFLLKLCLLKNVAETVEFVVSVLSKILRMPCCSYCSALTRTNNFNPWCQFCTVRSHVHIILPLHSLMLNILFFILVLKFGVLFSFTNLLSRKPMHQLCCIQQQEHLSDHAPACEWRCSNDPYNYRFQTWTQEPHSSGHITNNTDCAHCLVFGSKELIFISVN